MKLDTERIDLDTAAGQHIFWGISMISFNFFLDYFSSLTSIPYCWEYYFQLGSEWTQL